MQHTLFNEDTKSKRIEEVQIEKLVISKFNPRKLRSKEYVDKLAQRINNNGYEITRALWVYSENEHYEVFAGGTRLEASRIANLQKVPVVIHEGFTEEEIVRLADEDNENDEYHEPVPITEVWASYKALSDNGWTQERIAQAKGVNRALVSQKISYANFPKTILDEFVKNDFLKEGHASELNKLLNFNNLQPWLTREDAMKEIIDRVGENPNARKFEKEVSRYNLVIESVNKIAMSLPNGYGTRFIKLLADNKVRGMSGVKDVESQINYKIAEQTRIEEEKKRIELDESEQERIEAERKERIAKYREQFFNKFARLYHGNMVDVAKQVDDDSVDLIFTDPPYNENSIADYEVLAKTAARVLKPGGSLITYAGHYALPDIFSKMTDHLKYWWIIALQHSGNSARLPGKWVFVEWKPLLWFVKGTRSNNEYIADLFKSKQPDKEHHIWQQDVSEATYFIEHLTDKDGVVLDPFLGSGTTLLAAIGLGRKGIGIDVDRNAINTTRDRIDAYYTEHSESFQSRI